MLSCQVICQTETLEHSCIYTNHIAITSLGCSALSFSYSTFSPSSAQLYFFLLFFNPEPWCWMREIRALWLHSFSWDEQTVYPHLHEPLFLIFYIIYTVTLVENLGMIVNIRINPKHHTPMEFFLNHLFILLFQCIYSQSYGNLGCGR